MVKSVSIHAYVVGERSLKISAFFVHVYKSGLFFFPFLFHFFRGEDIFTMWASTATVDKRCLKHAALLVTNNPASNTTTQTAGCAVVELEAAFLIGTIAAINYLAFSRLLELVHLSLIHI